MQWLRVVLLDATPLPLYLQPLHAFSVVGSASPVGRPTKARALIERASVWGQISLCNRHQEIGRIEAAVDDPEFHSVWAFGFTGVGKTSVVDEALKRTVENTRSGVNAVDGCELNLESEFAEFGG
jgi:hypothetical protein